VNKSAVAEKEPLVKKNECFGEHGSRLKGASWFRPDQYLAERSLCPRPEKASTTIISRNSLSWSLSSADNGNRYD